MMTLKKAGVTVLVILHAAAFAGCNSSRKTTLGLDVNVYLHPSSSDPADVLLQTAITKRLNESNITRLSLIHVRVEERTVILTGSAKADVKREAEKLARGTTLTLNGETIQPRDQIDNRIETQ